MGSSLFIPNITKPLTGHTTELVVMIVLYVGTQLASSYVSSFNVQDKNQKRLLFLFPFLFVPVVINFEAGLLVYWITTNTLDDRPAALRAEVPAAAGAARGERPSRRAVASEASRSRRGAGGRRQAAGASGPRATAARRRVEARGGGREGSGLVGGGAKARRVRQQRRVRRSAAEGPAAVAAQEEEALRPAPLSGPQPAGAALQAQWRAMTGEDNAASR